MHFVKTFIKGYLFRSALRRSGASDRHDIFGNAARIFLTNSFSAKQKALFAKIEQRRTSLLNDHTPLVVMDFGAGTGGVKRSEIEQQQGVQSTTIVSRTARASKPAAQARLLAAVASASKASSILELGSCVGLSGAYLLAGSEGGRLRTLEGSPEHVRIATETFQVLGLSNAQVKAGPFHETLSGVLDSSEPIDLAFIDGHHDGPATLRYFDQIEPHLTSGSVIIFDDINWSDGMSAAWRTIEGKPGYTSFRLPNLGLLAKT